MRDDDVTSVRIPAPTLPPDAADDVSRLPCGSPAVGVGPGHVLAGRYRLRERLAHGSFGVVYLAKDEHLDRNIAIKLLGATHLARREIVARFLQEARAAARITHPGIVMMFDYGLSESAGVTSAFIAMELVRGESLAARLAHSGRLAPAAALAITRQVASALDAAHQAEVLHRDLKPDNIYLVPDPVVAGGERVKVLDFGLAKLVGDDHTRPSAIFGTPRYMSPEQCRSARLLDHRSDIYALGCVLFELVTGRAPFEGSFSALLDRHQFAPIPRASEFSLEVTPALDDLVLQLLQKDPAMRPSSMAVVRRMIDSVGHRPVPPRPSRPVIVDARPAAAPAPDPTVLPIVRSPATCKRWPSLRGAPVIVAALAFVIAGALTAVMVRGSTTPAQPVAAHAP